MADTIKHSRRRWFQIRLRTLFVLVTLFALWLGWELNFIRERKAWLGEYHPVIQLSSWLDSRRDEPTIPFWRRWLGDTAQRIIYLPKSADADDHAAAQRLFPEAEIRN